jgi:hypothetical protein
LEWELHLEVVYGMDAAIDKGEPIELYIFDRGTYERKYVKAIIQRNPADLPGGEKLWVRDFKGKLMSQPWAIKILEETKPVWESLHREGR